MTTHTSYELCGRRKYRTGFLCLSDYGLGTVVTGLITIINGVAWSCFTSYELSKLAEFELRYDTLEKRENAETFEDKDGNEIDKDEVDYMLGLSKVEQKLCFIFIFLLLMLVFSGGCLMGAAMGKKKGRLYIWMVVVVIVCLYGLVVNAMDNRVYGFHTENNIQIVMWLLYVILMVDSYKCVYGYSKVIDRLREVSDNSSDLSTISDRIPMELAMAPPTYEQATVDDPPNYYAYMMQVSDTERSNGTGEGGTFLTERTYPPEPPE